MKKRGDTLKMRNEKEMYQLIIGMAKDDKRIKAVYMNGSRTNKNAEKDIFQDYDVVYVVTDTQPFIDDKEWINKFGDIWFMQYPDENPDYPSDKENFYGWLMQFKDGNRVDLHVESIAHAKEHITDDKLCKILLDKDNILPDTPEATDEDYYVFRMTCLFSVKARKLTQELGYVYNEAEEQACMEFLNTVYSLPKDTIEIVKE